MSEVLILGAEAYPGVAFETGGVPFSVDAAPGAVELTRGVEFWAPAAKVSGTSARRSIRRVENAVMFL